MSWVPQWTLLVAILVEFSLVFYFDENTVGWLLPPSSWSEAGGTRGKARGAGLKLRLRQWAYRALVRLGAYLVLFVPLFALRGALLAALNTLFIGIGRGVAWQVARLPRRPRGGFAVIGTGIFVASVFAGVWAAWRLAEPMPLPWVQKAWSTLGSGVYAFSPKLGEMMLNQPHAIIAFLAAYAFMFDGATLVVRAVLGSLNLVVTDLGPPWPPIVGAGAVLGMQAQMAAATSEENGGGGIRDLAAAGQAAKALNAGKVIGNLERVLILTLMLYGQYQLIGLVVAAKSIYRFEAASRGQAEYYLIGTLTSLLIAVAAGIFLQNAVSAEVRI